MRIAKADRSGETRRAATNVKIHPLWLRITHWINALAIIVLVMSGWQIYNASPLFAFSFSPSITLGEGLAGGLLWHFAAMWVFVLNGLLYVTLGVLTGRFRRKFLPIRGSELIADFKAAFAFRLSRQDLNGYNAIQKLFYIGVVIAGLVVVLSGLAIWKPVQLQELAALFGGYDTARYVHFFAMAAIVAFAVLHVVMALLVPKSLRTIIIGR